MSSIIRNWENELEKVKDEVAVDSEDEIDYRNDQEIRAPVVI